MFKNNFTFTKKQLGLLFVAVGILGAVGILSLDVINAGREGGIGPAQRLALGIAVAVALVGLTLIPLGDDAA
jgi:hypothetical protein